MLEVIVSLAAITLIGVRIMSALDNLNANVAKLQSTASQVLAKLSAPPADEAAIQAAADKVAAVDASLETALAPVSPPVA